MLEKVTLALVAFTAFVGALSLLFTAVGNALPAENKVGKFLRRFGADLKTPQSSPPEPPAAPPGDDKKSPPKN